MKNAHSYPEVYKRLRIDLRDLGCLMLNTESPVEEVIKGGVPYTSPDPKKFWVKGLLEHWHVTVRYGFLPEVSVEDVDAVLADFELPSSLHVEKLEVFPSPYEDEKYDCLVAIVNDDRLKDLNTALSVLPNVNTFPIYKSHITIGYFTELPEVKLRDVKTLDLDYGHVLPRNSNESK